MNEIKQLLEKVKLLNFKYEQVLKTRRQDFNIFSIMFKAHDEVKLHSKFLFELLNPKGSHHQQDVFLDLFLQQLEIKPEEFTSQNTYAQREYQNIDLFITNEQSQALIIENKIHAGDQSRQLERYHEIVQKEGFEQISIIYLTLEGHEPSNNSVGKLDKDLIKTISYKVDITNWLDTCIQVAARHPTLRETLVQYQTLVKKITGQSMIKGYTMEIKDLLLQGNNLQMALDIEEALPEAKIEVQLKFWEALETALKNRGHKVADKYKYSAKKVENFYKGSRNRGFYGLIIHLDELSRSEQLQLYFCIHVQKEWLVYGFVAMADDTQHIGDVAMESRFDDIGHIAEKLGFTRNKWWLGWYWPNPSPNFSDFRQSDESNTPQLFNEAGRKAYVNELADEIDQSIKAFQKQYVKVNE